MSAIKEIHETIFCKEAQSVFLAKEFYHISTKDAVKKTLSRLCKKGIITRLAKGIYCVVNTHKDEFGFAQEYPSIDDIAKTIATIEGIKIIPTAEYALNALHLSTQVQTSCVFLTNSTKRKIHLYEYKENEITFLHCSDKRIFQIQNKIMLLVTLSMKAIGNDNISSEQLKTIKEFINNVPTKDFLNDIKHAPKWIQKKLMS